MGKSKIGIGIKGIVILHILITIANCVVDGDDFMPSGDVKTVIELPEAVKKEKPTLYPILDSKIGKYGFKNAENRWAIRPIYDDSGLIQLKDEYYLVRKTDNGGKTRFFFLDKYGENVIGRQFENAREFASGIAMVAENGRMAIINRVGIVVDEVGEQNDPELSKNIMLDGRLLIATGKENIEDEKGKTRIRNVWTGRTIYEGTYHYAQNVEGRYAVVDDVMNQTTYLYGYNGKMKAIKDYYALRPGLEEIIMGPYKRKDPYKGDLYVYNLKKDTISPFSEWKDYGDKAVLEKILDFENGKRLFVYMVNGPVNFIMLYKEPMTKDNKETKFCSFLGEFEEGLAPVQLDFRGRSYYYINEDGKYAFDSMINGSFQKAYEFVDGYAFVQLGARREGRYYNDKWCYIDRKGQIRIREDIGYIAEPGKWILEKTSK